MCIWNQGCTYKSCSSNSGNFSCIKMLKTVKISKISSRPDD